MYKPPKNPQIEELTKSCKKRAYRLSDFKIIRLDGKNKNCVWCLGILDGNKRKWCSEECVTSALAWARPQCEEGLHVLLVRQDFKCLLCDLSYWPYIEKALAYLNRYRKTIDPASVRTKISRLLMRVFREQLPRSIRAEVDHILAITLGGTSLGLENHRVLCALCHKGKTKSDIQEKFAKNGNPRKGVGFTQEHCDAMSESRKGFDSENRKKSREENLYPTLRKPVTAINLATKEERSFDSCEDAAKSLGLQSSNISRVLRGDKNRKQHKGWTFRYREV
jgi:hypothetical protein